MQFMLIALKHSHISKLQFHFTIIIFDSDAVSGWAGWVLAHPEFGTSVSPIPTHQQNIIFGTVVMK
jgi:hypothetical protein